MRILNGILAFMMVAFAAVQYNDPDALFWVVIYLAAGAWAGFAAFRPLQLDERNVRRALLATLGVAIALMVAFWPQDAFWWRQDVWWESEAAREGMGLMICTGVIAIVVATAFRPSRSAVTET